jgi:UDP-glucose 4-epimerase
VYVGDVVAANLAAASSNATGPFNIGTGVASSVLDIVNALAPLADRSFEPHHEPERLGEVQNISLDTTRAREELGWEARVGLDEGLRITLESLR